MSGRSVFLDQMIRDGEGVSIRDIVEAWVDWHGAEKHGECRVCELAEWLNGCMVFGMHPQPFQGTGDDSDTYKNQSIVYDGVWECVDGALWFVGADGCGGGRGPAKRKIVYGDRVIFF